MQPAGVILILLADYPLWSEGFLHREIRALLDLDGRFRLAALRRVTEHPGRPSPAAAPSQLPAFVLDSAPAAPAAGSSGLRCLPVAAPWLRPWLSRLRHGAALAALRRHCRAAAVRHIHAEFCDLPAQLARIAAAQLGISYSVSTHARDVFCCKYPLTALLRDACFVSVCNSAALHELRRTRAVAEEHLHLVHHGLPLHEWPLAPALPATRPIQLFWAGRLVPKKGLDLLFHALAGCRLPAESGWQLRLAGDGPEAARLAALCQSLGIGGAVTWQPPLSAEALRQEMANAHALVLPAQVAPDGDRDGIPNIALEAMASGCPVICTPTGGLTDIAGPATAWLAEDASVPALTAAIESFTETAAESIQARRQGARALVEREFDLAVTTARRQRLFAQYLDETV